MAARIASLPGDDIQALVRSGFGTLSEATFLLCRITDRPAAAAWLGALPVTSVGDLERDRVTQAVQVALTSEGLRALGVPDAALGAFAPEFLSGMAGDEARSRRLGDVGENAPERWDWGWGEREPHLILMLYAETGGLPAWRERFEPGPENGLALVAEIASDDLGGREPFGFNDGASQPSVDWEDRRTPGTRADLDYGNLIAPGEFLLGYRNEYGELTERPLLEDGQPASEQLPPAKGQRAMRDLGRNGSYLVVRDIAQDVRGFWTYMTETAGAASAVKLAELMVGRRMTGEPLAPVSKRTIPGVGPQADDRRLNNFTYDGDPDGFACPLGAHVRRANPRTGDLPGGRRGVPKEILGRLGLYKPELREDVVASARFHRLLRRGRPYGTVLTPADAVRPETPDPGAGLFFACLNANITRQFEFVQNAWMVNAKFAGLSGEADPLLGSRIDFPEGVRTDGFSTVRLNRSMRHLRALPRFTTVVGGAYFFLPGIRALRYFAAAAAAAQPR
jgi:deferrochelatase/peroxidase EfeB